MFPEEAQVGGSQLDISVVICSRNRAAQLAKSLAILKNLKSSNEFEVAVVDNGSTDDTPAVIGRFRDSAHSCYPGSTNRSPASVEPGTAGGKRRTAR
jgi:GT2 family glycosyltransferase